MTIDIIKIWTPIIADMATAIASIVIALSAVYGVGEWKRQLKGKTNYETAKRYLRASLQLRDAMRFVRNPMISLAEMEASLKEHGLENSEYADYQKTNRAVYSIRWKKVQEAWTKLEIESLEAEVGCVMRILNTKMPNPQVD